MAACTRRLSAGVGLVRDGGTAWVIRYVLAGDRLVVMWACCLVARVVVRKRVYQSIKERLVRASRGNQACKLLGWKPCKNNPLASIWGAYFGAWTPLGLEIWPSTGPNNWVSAWVLSQAKIWAEVDLKWAQKCMGLGPIKTMKDKKIKTKHENKIKIT